MAARDLINILQEVTGSEFDGSGDATNGIYYDITKKTTDDDGTERLGNGIYGSIQKANTEITKMYEVVEKAAEQLTDVGEFVDQTDKIEVLEEFKTKVEGIHFDTNEPTGYIREQIGTVGILEVTTDGENIHKIGAKGQGEYEYINSDKFYNGDTIVGVDEDYFVARLTPKVDGEDSYGKGVLQYYVEGVKFTRTEHLEVRIPKTTGMHFLYLEKDGTLHTSTILHHDMFDGPEPHYFEDTPITAVMYYNADQSKLAMLGDERHGITMDGYTHFFWHVLFGTQYAGGMGIVVNIDDNTHGQIQSGSLYDEDLYMPLPSQTEAPIFYSEGKDWFSQAGHGTNDLFMKVDGDDYISYNKYDTDNETYSLVQLAEDEFTLMFFVATNNAISPYIKLIGQQVYTDINDGRSSIETEITLAKTRGLPTPEFLFIGAILVNSAGEAQDLTDGGAYLDLRFAKLSGSSATSAATVVAADVTYDNYNSTLTTTTVKGALDELDNRASKDFRYKGAIEVADDDVNLQDVQDVFKIGDSFRFKRTGTGKLLVNGTEYIVTNDSIFMCTVFRADPADLVVEDLLTTLDMSKMVPSTEGASESDLLSLDADLNLVWTSPEESSTDNEAVRDIVGDALVGGTNITITVDDDNDTITIDNDLVVGDGGLTEFNLTAARKDKVDYLTVTEATDLDEIRTRVVELDQAVVLKGEWDASAGTFPDSDKAGQSWSVSVEGTVDDVEFKTGDRVAAIVDNAATDTYLDNWIKLDYSDRITSVGGLIGDVTKEDLNLVIGTDIQAYDANTVIDENYVATENNFTTVLKDKLTDDVADKLQTIDTTTIYDDSNTETNYKLYVEDGKIVLEEL